MSRLTNSSTTSIFHQSDYENKFPVQYDYAPKRTWKQFSVLLKSNLDLGKIGMSEGPTNHKVITVVLNSGVKVQYNPKDLILYIPEARPIKYHKRSAAFERSMRNIMEEFTRSYKAPWIYPDPIVVTRRQ